MIIAYFVGRILVGAYFVYNAYSHLAQGSQLAPYAASKNIPSPRIAVFVSGLLLLAGGFSLAAGLYTTWGIVILLLFMIPVTYTMHAFWKENDPYSKANDKIAFFKNIAIIGFLLMALAIPTPWPLAF